MREIKRFLRLAASMLCLCGVVACSPVEQPTVERNKKAYLSEEFVHASDGAQLHYQSWDVKKPRAVILALHGFNDYSNTFKLFAPYMQKRKIATFTYDQRGFGRNEMPGIWGGNENLSRDVCDAMDIMQKKYGNTPIYVLGDSMGASVVIHAQQFCDRNDFKGLILVAPALWGEETMNPFFRFTLWLAAHTIPSKEFTGEDLKIQATDNIEILHEMMRDPYVIKSTRVDAVYGLLKIMDAAHADLEQLPQLPALILYGGNDQVIPPHTIDNLSKKIPHALRIDYANGYHLLLTDLQREKVYNDILQWMKETGYAKP